MMAAVVRLSERMGPEAFFEKNTGLNVAKLGDIIRREEHILRGADGSLYAYSEGVYKPRGEQIVAERVRELLRERFRAQHIREVETWLKAFRAEIGDDEPSGILNVANGILGMETGELRDHSPDCRSTVQLPVRWDPEATCPRFDRFLREVLPEDAIPMVWEVIGYSLHPSNPFRKAVLLLGPGGNGKSVLLNVIQALLGRENVAGVPLQTLAEERFSGEDLYRKLANVCGDLDARAIRRTDVFKQLTGGDAIRVDRKYRSAITFRCGALPLFSANQAPLTSDTTEAWFSRWIIVPMETRIPENKQDENLTSKLTQAEELEGILAHAVLALDRLLARSGFERPATVTDADTSYRRFADSVTAFLEERCVVGGESWTPRTRLYKAYKAWTDEAGRHAFADRVFYAHVANLGLRPAKLHGTRGFRGVSLCDD